jgi:hypothetical protein
VLAVGFGVVGILAALGAQLPPPVVLLAGVGVFLLVVGDVASHRDDLLDLDR